MTLDRDRYQLSARVVEFSGLADDDPDRALIVGRVRGMASTDDLNSFNMVVLPQAFDASIPDLISFPQLLYNHDWGRQAGAIRSVKRTDNGIEIEADIANTELGREVWTLISLGGLRAFSVGFNPTDGTFDSKTGIETITEAELQEVSIVGRPANKKATFEGITVSAERRAAEEKQEKQAAQEEQELYELAVALGVSVVALAAINISAPPRKDENDD